MVSSPDSKKQKKDVEEDSSSSEDEGPALPSQAKEPEKATKQHKKLKYEKVYLEQLPNSDMYEKSYMHRDVVTHTVVTPKTDFIVTASRDGQLKFWKKVPGKIEFVKNYRAHLKAISSLSVSADGLRLCSTSVDQTVKFFDVVNFDMVNMIKAPFVPSFSMWISKTLVALSDKDGPIIHIFNYETGSNQAKATIKLHTAPVTCMAYNLKLNCAISCDTKGVIEYWNCDDYKFPANNVNFSYKMDTDLFELVKTKTYARSIDFSKNGKYFVVTCSDSNIIVYHFKNGKMHRKYDESLATIEKAHSKGETYGIDEISYGRRIAQEKELASATDAPVNSVIFDESGFFIFVPAILGIKIINIKTNQVVKVIGKFEVGERFLNLSLYQGTPKVDHQLNQKLQGANQSTTVQRKDKGCDPVLIATSFNKDRFYLFTRREPEDTEGAEQRDVFNEKPIHKGGGIGSSVTVAKKLGRQAVIHTSMGDITLKLFPEDCPKTIENFTTHSMNGYYNNVIFHRVIKSFMIQTGDPLGNGTGGTSIWGTDFEDEISRNLRHDRPYTVSMANAGPNTNGSQFFITTAAAVWLDGKHTVFGRVTKGMDVVHQIENVFVDATDKPQEDIKILNIDITSF